MVLGNFNFVYLLWEWSYGAILMEVTPAPTELPKLAQWQVKDARAMSWILGSIDPQIVLNLKPYKTAKSM